MNTLMIVLGSASAGCFIGVIIASVLRAGGNSDTLDAHDRCADALATLRARVDSALAAETPSAAPAAKRICRILRGEE
jgi:hypothetical protein